MAYLAQLGGERVRVGRAGAFEPFIMVALVVCIGAVTVPLLWVVVSSWRDTVRGWRRWRTAANAELRTRALMSELCPHGWRAQITVLSGGTAGPVERERVALEWTELQDDSGRPAVMRRVVAPTIGEALEAMVADRRTDQTLEQIEQGAVAEGILWPDV